MTKKFVFIAAVFLAICTFYMTAYADTLLEVTFSHESGFYSQAFDLTLGAPAGARIFFTTDGSYPTERSTRFNRAIPMRAANQTRLHTIRAIAVLDGETSEIATRNFFVGSDVLRRFCENTLIFALTSDPHGLFDHYEGIFVPGIDRQRWREDFVRRHGRQPESGFGYGYEYPAAPANFNRRGRESERPVHVEMF
ncbi:MAG: chitobiase/beta-hexosaminidase C-terminal domain-containing protein, partial [Defluviitaleaceae bacterium]|nr:chitobiase/beta-hexosaminidase C-terminal domain-containing protein [Defluviitaleaceae bacterium]